MIHTAESWYAPMGAHLDVAGAAELAPLLFSRPPAPLPTEQHRGLFGFVPAVVNDGRWIAQCPSCRSAQFASRTDPRFFCHECRNDYVGGVWLAVAWAPDADNIADALEPRPTGHAHWRPGETLGRLVQENDKHGVPTPDHVREAVA